MFRNVGDERRWVLGIDELSAIESPDLAKNKAIQEWVFGFLSYEMKNSLEGLHSRSKDELGYPTSYWFVPRFVFEMNDKGCVLHVHGSDESAGRELACCSGMTPKFRVGGSGSGSHVPRERIISTP